MILYLHTAKKNARKKHTREAEVRSCPGVTSQMRSRITGVCMLPGLPWQIKPPTSSRLTQTGTSGASIWPGKVREGLGGPAARAPVFAAFVVHD